MSRFVGDVDTVENLFTSGIISMFADACKIVSILGGDPDEKRRACIASVGAIAIFILVYPDGAEEHAESTD